MVSRNGCAADDSAHHGVADRLCTPCQRSSQWCEAVRNPMLRASRVSTRERGVMWNDEAEAAVKAITDQILAQMQ